MPLERYIYTGKRKLRCGYTTGSCAALAAKAATWMLLSGKPVAEAEILTPDGTRLAVPVEDIRMEPERVTCAVRKDAGDDPDITDGILLYAQVTFSNKPGVRIEGGAGIGRVTLPGLDQPVGAAAINHVPRQMIIDAIVEVAEALEVDVAFSVLISAPEGEKLAMRTFNPSLGIVDGISILGTTGIVEPMSEQSYIDSIQVTLKQQYALGARKVLLTPGSIGTAYVRMHKTLSAWTQVKCSNFVGDAIDAASSLGFQEILLAGHIGKLVKVASGVMQTHSKYADARMETLCAFTALAGGNELLLEEILHAATTDAALEKVTSAHLLEGMLSGMLTRMDFYLARRAGEDCRTGAMLFATGGALLGISPAAKKIVGET